MSEAITISMEDYEYREESLVRMFNLIVEISATTGGIENKYIRFKRFRKIFEEYEKPVVEDWNLIVEEIKGLKETNYEEWKRLTKHIESIEKGDFPT